MMREQGCFKPLLLAGLLSLGTGCADQGSSGAGRLELRLVDAPADDVKEIVVTITRVEAHVAGGGWQVLAEENATVDLLRLQGGTFAQLGVVNFPGGKVTQLRLYVKEDGPNYVTTPDGVQHPLTVPSGTESGIKIKGGFDWNACDVGNVTIDFDGKKSIFVHPKGAGAGDEWLLRPVVRLKSVSVTGDGCKPDAGAPDTNPEMSTPAPIQPPPDAGPVENPPIMTDPPSNPDPCATITCAEGQFCYTGGCINNIE
jgi:hypothetical protein